MLTVYDIASQLVGFAGMGAGIWSFQQKTHKKVVMWQVVSNTLFTINMFMLGAVSGGLMNAIGVVRAIVFMNREKIEKNIKWYVAAFIAAPWIMYVLIFTLFGKEATLRNLILELLPIIAMSITTVGVSMRKAKNVRVAFLINSPLWLTYNIFNKAIGGFVAEVFNSVSIIIGFIRLDRKGKE